MEYLEQKKRGRKSAGQILVFLETMMISFAVLCVIGLNGVLSFLRGQDFSLSWYQPAAILLTGFLSALPTLLLYSDLAEGEKFGNRTYLVNYYAGTD